MILYILISNYRDPTNEYSKQLQVYKKNPNEIVNITDPKRRLRYKVNHDQA